MHQATISDIQTGAEKNIYSVQIILQKFVNMEKIENVMMKFILQATLVPQQTDYTHTHTHTDIHVHTIKKLWHRNEQYCSEKQTLCSPRLSIDITLYQ